MLDDAVDRKKEQNIEWFDTFTLKAPHTNGNLDLFKTTDNRFGVCTHSRIEKDFYELIDFKFATNLCPFHAEHSHKKVQIHKYVFMGAPRFQQWWKNGN